MSYTFYKYHGTGNDFVMIDDRSESFPVENTELVKKICTRRFGVGADGCILLQNHPTADFRMVYFNSDGNQSTMCGNGGRCIVAFANFLGVIQDSCSFEAIDGMHEANITNGIVSLKMIDVSSVENLSHGNFLDTGSPHIVIDVNQLNDYDVFANGKRIRDDHSAEGSNVNFVEWKNDVLAVRTYERGVENETFSCGTGVTAAAIASTKRELNKTYNIPISTIGGELSVEFTWTENGAREIWLNGPAVLVFRGEW